MRRFTQKSGHYMSKKYCYEATPNISRHLFRIHPSAGKTSRFSSRPWYFIWRNCYPSAHIIG
jgi:hypothetical protein